MAIVVELYLHEEKEVWNTFTLKKSFKKKKKDKSREEWERREDKKKSNRGDEEVREKHTWVVGFNLYTQRAQMFVLYESLPFITFARALPLCLCLWVKRWRTEFALAIFLAIVIIHVISFVLLGLGSTKTFEAFEKTGCI